MNEYVPYVFIFAIVVLVFRLITQFAIRDRSSWQACAQKYRLNFREGKEDKGERTIRAFRLKGYYRTCLVSIFSSPSMGASETSVTVSYPKNLLDNLVIYPEGTLTRIGRGLTRQADANAPSSRPFLLAMPPPKGTGALEVQKELNPVVRERLLQLMMVCSGKGRRIDMTDAYLLYRETGFKKKPEELFPIIDEILLVINVLEDNVGELLR